MTAHSDRHPRSSGGSSKKQALEKELQLRSDALVERMKELDCLHSVSGLLAAKHLELGDVFQRVAELLPSAWQYPEFACARITLRNRTYQSQNFGDCRYRQRAEIVADGASIGSVEVGYTESFPNGQEPQFLPEESNVLATVARRLAETYSLKESQIQLATYQQHLRSLASELTLTEERARRRLALHLHDSIGQGLAVTKLKLETLRHILPEEFRDRVGDILGLLQNIIADTRTITAEISPPILYELSFFQALVWLGDHFKKQFGLDARVIGTDADLQLGEGVRVMLFRSVQELLTNVVKHARATSVQIGLSREGNELQVVVADNGIGLDIDQQHRYPSASGGFGIFSIRERLAHLGGRMTIDSDPGKGTRIVMWVPTAN